MRVSFINRWSRATFMIPEGDAVCIGFSNIRGSTKSAIALGDCRTFPDLDERAVRMERGIRDGTIAQYTGAPRTESEKTRIKKNTATDQVNALQSTTTAQRPTTASSGEELRMETSTGNSAGKATSCSKTTSPSTESEQRSASRSHTGTTRLQGSSSTEERSVKSDIPKS